MIETITYTFRLFFHILFECLRKIDTPFEIMVLAIPEIPFEIKRRYAGKTNIKYLGSGYTGVFLVTKGRVDAQKSKTTGRIIHRSSKIEVALSFFK